MNELAIDIPLRTEETKKSFWITVLNFSSIMFGAGCLSLGVAFAKMGYVLGTGMVVTMGLLSIFSIILIDMLLFNSDQKDESTLSALARGRKRFALFIDLFIVLSSFLTTVYYYTLVIELILFLFEFFCAPLLISNMFFYLSNFVITMAVLAILVKTSGKEPKWMTWVMVGSIGCVVLILIILACFFHNQLRIGELVWISTELDYWNAISAIIFAFSCQQSYIYRIKDLIYSTERRRKQVIWASIGFGIVFYSLIGLLSYFIFGNISSDILTELFKGYLHLPGYVSQSYKMLYLVSILALRIVFVIILTLAIGYQTAVGRESFYILAPKIKLGQKTALWGYTLAQIMAFLLCGFLKLSPENALTLLGAITEPLLNFIVPFVSYLCFKSKNGFFTILSIIFCIFFVSLSGVSIHQFITGSNNNSTFELQCNTTVD
ncbi:Transmembrane amino acid transporter [Tubulinosema ratisbonensis]|uniref:Transmembrane amino acid transporter n=1 Tax=Tubulinosema ratisbonensis TaxID=291195 RepID=A0A437AJ89_9MICR|nr:Transmembrane amino acid transporter [Tubulinosema ratisbonensis]